MKGAIIGDIVGSRFEFNNYRYKDFDLFTERSFYTDDSVMTLAVADFLLSGKHTTANAIKTLQKYGRNYMGKGYGCSFLYWIYQNNPKPYNSFGNGAAMRISPVGLYAKSEKEVKRLSKIVTEISHDHEEGLKGAEVTAMCVFYAKHGKSKQFIKKYVEKYYDLDFDYETLRATYVFNETCQDTVPQAIWCFLNSNSFVDCVRTCISIGGDSDTLAAISCSIAEVYYGIPKQIEKEMLYYLDKDQIKLINRFYNCID